MVHYVGVDYNEMTCGIGSGYLPNILGDEPAAGGVREQSCAASTTSAILCLCRLASRRRK